MKKFIAFVSIFVFSFLLSAEFSQATEKQKSKTVVSIKGDKFLINGVLTYKGRNWQGHSIEGFDDGYQPVPVNWGISSQRKKAFFDKLEEITGGL